MIEKLSHLLQSRQARCLNSLPLTTQPVSSAVLVLLYHIEDHPNILFTRRSQNVAHHKGQICFPGGVRDEVDPSLWETALRESEEEIGVQAQDIQYIGELGSVVTPTGFQISPYVGWHRGPLTVSASPVEIEEVFWAPVEHFMKEGNLHYVTRTYFGNSIQDPVFRFNHHEIWGATARILVDFLEAWNKCR